MSALAPRSPREAAAVGYDLIVVGGGAYGVMLALEAARRRLRPLLLERDDFGGATTWNHLRIVHGGLRYLQSLDLHRFRESVAERRWMLKSFPDLVQPLRCLMPLYGDGLKRPAVLRAALALNDFLSRHRNRGVRADRALPGGEVLDAAGVASLYPAVDRTGLRGGAVWYDGVTYRPERLLMETLRWAASYGATALNYVEAEALVVRGERVAGVRAVDRDTGATFEYRAPAVVNCAGPWSRGVARRFDRDLPELFEPSIAFNVLLDRAPLAECALALTPRRAGARTYFMYPYRGRVLAGTFHAPWTGALERPVPSEALVAAFLDDLNAAAPGWSLGPGDVVRVFAGLLPAAERGTDRLAVREVIHDHGAAGGPRGLYSVSGVKFTTARLVAEKTLRLVHPGLSEDPVAVAGTERPLAAAVPDYPALARLLEDDPARAAAVVSRIAQEESVVRLDDLLLRRTDWGLHPDAPADLADTLARLLERFRLPAASPASDVG